MFSASSVYAAPTIGIQDTSPVDIVLTGGETDFDYEGFADKLTNELVLAGVSRERIHITADETKSFSSTDDGLKIMQNDWYCLPKNSANRPVIKGGELVGPSPAGILICNEDELNGYVEIDMNFTWWCAVHVGGFTPRITKLPNGDYAGYFISLEAPSKGTQSPNGAFGSAMCPVLYRVDGFSLPNGWDYLINPIGNAFRNGTMLSRGSSVPTRGASQPHTAKCILDKNVIQVWLDGKLCLYYDLKDEGLTYTKGTMGYGLSNSVHIGLSSVSFTMGAVTPLVDAVRSSDWRNHSGRFIVDVCDTPREDFDNPGLLGELVQRMLANDAYYIGWGTSSSKSSMDKFIARNENKGKFFNTKTERDIYRSTAQYIAPIVNHREDLNGRVYLYKDKEYSFE